MMKIDSVNPDTGKEYSCYYECNNGGQHDEVLETVTSRDIFKRRDLRCWFCGNPPDIVSDVYEIIVVETYGNGYTYEDVTPIELEDDTDPELLNKRKPVIKNRLVWSRLIPSSRLSSIW